MGGDKWGSTRAVPTLFMWRHKLYLRIKQVVSYRFVVFIYLFICGSLIISGFSSVLVVLWFLFNKKKLIPQVHVTC